MEQLLQVSCGLARGGVETAMSPESFRKAMNNEFPSTFFLDHHLFSPITHHLPSQGVPSFVQKAIHLTKDDWPSICDDFFSTIHTWLPILSRKVLIEQIQSGSHEHEGENAVLLLSLKLSTHPIDASDDSQLYHAVKSCLFFAESGGFLSLRLVQALLLLCLFELGHGMYPAAYLTAGRVARLACTIGLHDRKQAVQLYVSPETWTQREEQRRTWWAVLLVERLSVLGNPGLPLTAPQPGTHDLLPCNEEYWDKGVMGINEPLPVTLFHSSSPIGPFARTCQAIHVVGNLIKNINRRRDPDAVVTETLTEALQLHKALMALAASLDLNGSTPAPEEAAYPRLDTSSPRDHNHCALALCASAMCLWNCEYGYNGRRHGHGGERIALETEAQKMGYYTVTVLCTTIAPRLARHLVQLAAAPDTKAQISPVAGHSMYMAVLDCANLLKQYGNNDGLHTALGHIVDGMEAIQSQWLVGGKQHTSTCIFGITMLTYWQGSI